MRKYIAAIGQIDTTDGSEHCMSTAERSVDEAASAGAMPAASAAEKRREIKVLSSMIPSSLSADRQAADADGRLADVGRHAAAERAAHALPHRHVLTDAVNAH